MERVFNLSERVRKMSDQDAGLAFRDRFWKQFLYKDNSTIYLFFSISI